MKKKRMKKILIKYLLININKIDSLSIMNFSNLILCLYLENYKKINP